MRNPYVLQGYLLEDSGVPQTLSRVQDLKAGQVAFSVVVGRDTFVQVLGCDRGFAKADVQRVDVLVVGNPHNGLLRNSTRKRSQPRFPGAPPRRSAAPACL